LKGPQRKFKDKKDFENYQQQIEKQQREPSPERKDNQIININKKESEIIVDTIVAVKILKFQNDNEKVYSKAEIYEFSRDFYLELNILGYFKS
jgi:hypothetical protein